MSHLNVQANTFYLNNEPIQLLSGAMHYFRVVPEYWEDRLRKLKACGLNCVETYVPWNFHEPNEGEFNFTGMADIETFIQTAQRIGLYVIIRPSPFICAEWEFGGLPAWLLSDRNMPIRSSAPRFLEKVDTYYDTLMPKLRPHLHTNGGPIIMMQVENEYGSYANDKTYLTYLKKAMETRGIDVLLATSDGPTPLMLAGGTLDDVLPTVNFGSQPTKHFNTLQEHFPGIPNMVMEFWIGWFDHWGEEHHTREGEDAAQAFREMLASGASVNFFMFHGGTNFAFWNGANHDDGYQPTVTSYDYDSLLTESGDLTEKYHAVRAAIGEHYPLGELELPEPIPKKAYGMVEMIEKVNLFDVLERISEPVKKAEPVTMEKAGQNYGFILYRTFMQGPHDMAPLSIRGIRDRALIFVNGNFRGIIDRWKENTIDISIPEDGAQIDILVENLGRVNYGPHLYDPKGILEGVRFSYQFLSDWTIYPLPMDNLEQLEFKEEDLGLTDEFTRKSDISQPAFYRGTFHVDEAADTFIHLPGWVKGFVVVNGFNIGRYWEIGPQETLYIPGPLLHEGENELVIFELHGTENETISLIDHPILG